MSVYKTITDKIIQQLKEGTVPWRKPWTSALPKNAVSQQSYRGINLLLLSSSGFSSEYWATFRQIQKLGGSVIKGERGTGIVYANWIKREDEKTGEEKAIPFLKKFTVFNVEQTLGLDMPAEEEKPKLEPIERCEQLTRGMIDPPHVAFDGGDRAFYRPATDSIHLPSLQSFNSAEDFFCTAFHEYLHSTGHSSRLGRKGVTETAAFGSDVYSLEEITAEIGAAFLCGMAEIEPKTLKNSANYIAGWLKALQDDQRLVVVAAAQAQRAVDYIMQNRHEADVEQPTN